MTSPAHSPLFGVLNINKPHGWTSRDVVNRVQRFVRPLKCGHAGTLDPMATGVLLVCIGQATRLVDVLHLLPKSYEAEFTLGVTSNTDDGEGVVAITSADFEVPNHAVIERALTRFVGTIEQTPPAFSAVHVNGQRAYQLARRGDDVQLPSKTVRIDAIELLSFEWPRLHVRIQCGSGTYIRSIARDLGTQLGCGGVMSSLVRTAIGSFDIEHSCELDQLQSDGLSERLVPAAAVVEHIPAFDCGDAAVELVRCGRAIALDRPDIIFRGGRGSIVDSSREGFRRTGTAEPHESASTPIALMANNFTQLIALAELTDSQQLQPRQVFL